MKLTAENTTVSTAIAKPANEGAVAGSVGVGASVALNIANTVTVAELEDGVVLTGAKDLILSATSDNSVITTAKAGGAATGGSGVGIGGAIGISVANNETRAELGSRRAADGYGAPEGDGDAHGEHADLCGRECGWSECGDRDCAGSEHRDGQHAGDDGEEHCCGWGRDVCGARLWGEQCGGEGVCDGWEGGGLIRPGRRQGGGQEGRGGARSGGQEGW